MPGSERDADKFAESAFTIQSLSSAALIPPSGNKAHVTVQMSPKVSYEQLGGQV